MGKLIDLTGQRFGRLTIISRIPELNKWNCLCYCGNKTIVYPANLKKGNTKSCGCLNDHGRLSDETLAAKNSLFYNYKKRAQKRGYSFSLNFEEFVHLIQQDCYYCGEKPNQFIRRKYTHKIFFYNGLDRLNNNSDYSINNVVPCCKKCNRSKWERNQDEFIIWIKRCYDHLKFNEL